MRENSESAYGRRDIIKKTAVAGAVAWTAPLIVSSRALAQVPSDDPGPVCANYYMVKIDLVPLGAPDEMFCELDKGYVHVNDWTKILVSGSYREGNAKNDAGGGRFTLQPGITLVAVTGKKRKNECNDVTPSGPGPTFFVAGGQSHIIVVVCSDLVFEGIKYELAVASKALPPLADAPAEPAPDEPAPVAEEPAPVADAPAEPAPVAEAPAGG